ncbi:MAG TPA: hypothetical protein DCE44_24760, partial [Verrucomicrobiales bacterium]|nr:hypothetical protein [Verrucomicrobiales bacterium]
DGFSDMAVGLPSVRDDAGEVLIFHGGPVLQWSEPDEQLRPNQPRTSFGFFGRGPSDFNRDGFADLLVGSPHFSVRGSHNGRAQLFLGSLKGLQTNAAWTAIYPFRARPNVDGDFQYFGNFLVVDDFNRDGLIDAVITAPFASQNDQSEGMAFGYYGTRYGPGLPANFDWSIQANREATVLGLMAERIGDVNGDGYPDLLLGAPDYGNQQLREGLAVVFFGSRRGFAKSPGWALEGQNNHTAMGLWAAGVGDLNGDGFDDFVLSQNGSGSLEGFFPASVGALRVIYGSPIGPRGSTGITFRKPAVQWVAEEWRRMSGLKRSAVGASGLALVALVGVAGRRIWKKRTIVLVEKRERQSLANERERLSRDLHDELGSRISRIHLIAELVHDDPDAPGTLRTHTEALTREAKDLRSAIEQVVSHLKPSENAADGLVRALSQHASAFFSGTSVRYFQELPLDPPPLDLPPEVREQLLLCVREALANVLRHSKATEAWLKVRAEPSCLSVFVEDNGIGFVPSETRGGNGLANFKVRMSEIGGSAKVESALGRGSCVRFEVPASVRSRSARGPGALAPKLGVEPTS